MTGLTCPTISGHIQTLEHAADGEDEQREPLLQAQATLEQKLE